MRWDVGDKAGAVRVYVCIYREDERDIYCAAVVYVYTTTLTNLFPNK
jgi:hypothetical protein